MEQEEYSTKERKWEQITEKKRYQIEALLKANTTKAEIARLLGYSRRTIEREIKNGMVEQLIYCKTPNREKGDLEKKYVYCADAAQRRHDEKAANKGRNLKIGSDHWQVAFIEEKIKMNKWSPDAVLGYIEAKRMPFLTTICTKTLYNYIDRGMLLGISNKDLLRKKEEPKREYNRVRRVALNNRNGLGIEERGKEIEERKEQGHWELDLVVGNQGTKPAVLTLVERASRKSIYILIRNKTQKEILAAIRKAVKKVGGNFDQVFKTITTDNGSEFLDGAGIKEASGCDDIYYAHPYCSWEKGSNENGNSMLRRFFPKGTNFETVTEEELQRTENWVNSYPRKIFGYLSANDVYAAS